MATNNKKQIVKTLTFGLGKVMAWDATKRLVIPFSDEQGKKVYTSLRDTSVVVARIINILNSREYVHRIMEVPDSVVEQFKPYYSLVKPQLERLGIEEAEKVAGCVLSQTYMMGCKPDFAGEHGKSLICKGERQIPLHRTDGTHPIPQRAAETRLFMQDKRAYLAVQVFAATWAKKNGLPSGWIAFPIKVKRRDKRMLSEISRTIKGEWKLKNSRIMRNSRKKGQKWLGQISVGYEPKPYKLLREDVVMGIDLGVNIPACLHIRENGNPFEWAMGVGRGRDMLHCRNIVRSEILRILRALKGKDSPLDDKAKRIYREKLRGLRSREKRLMKKASQKVADVVADTAKRNGAGVWRIEALSSDIKDGQPWLARNWAPAMVVDALSWQAKKCGATIEFVLPDYTSQRCAECGHIAKENRPKGKKKQASFKCVLCGHEDNADKNAARNISIRNIEDLILAALPDGEVRDNYRKKLESFREERDKKEAKEAKAA